jgi:hypothetical protein
MQADATDRLKGTFALLINIQFALRNAIANLGANDLTDSVKITFFIRALFKFSWSRLQFKRTFSLRLL